MIVIHKSQNDDGNNFNISKQDDELIIHLTYPPWTNEENKTCKCRYVCIDQDSVRASDGIRVHYDYTRDGFVIEQPVLIESLIGDNTFDQTKEWVEVGFFKSWHFEDNEETRKDDALPGGSSK